MAPIRQPNRRHNRTRPTPIRIGNRRRRVFYSSGSPQIARRYSDSESGDPAYLHRYTKNAAPLGNPYPVSQALPPEVFAHVQIRKISLFVENAPLDHPRIISVDSRSWILVAGRETPFCENEPETSHPQLNRLVQIELPISKKYTKCDIATVFISPDASAAPGGEAVSNSRWVVSAQRAPSLIRFSCLFHNCRMARGEVPK